MFHFTQFDPKQEMRKERKEKNEPYPNIILTALLAVRNLLAERNITQST